MSGRGSKWDRWGNWSSEWRSEEPAEAEDSTWHEDDSWHEEASSSRANLRPRQEGPPDYVARQRREESDAWWAAEAQWSEWGQDTAGASWQSQASETWQDDESQPEESKTKRSRKKRKQATFTEEQLAEYEAAFWRNREGVLRNREEDYDTVIGFDRPTHEYGKQAFIWSAPSRMQTRLFPSYTR